MILRILQLLDRSGEEEKSADLSASAHSKYKRRRKNGKKRKNRNKRKKNKKRKHFKPFWQDDDSDDYNYNYEDYDRDSGYSAPHSGYEAPHSGYEAPTYSAPSYEAPHSGYGAPSYSAPSYGGGHNFEDFLNALAAFLPIALFLAAIPPNLVVVNNKRRKRRFVGNDIDDSQTTSHYPFIRKIAQMGLEQFYSDRECQKRIFCEMVSYPEESANGVQSALRTFVKMAPTFVEETFGAENLFENSRSAQCRLYKCPSKNPSTSTKV